MVKPTNNKQALRSKQWISNSLLELMKTNDFSVITIQEITLSAQLDRRTFYRHFCTKKDVLSYYLDIIFFDYIKKLNMQNNSEYKMLKGHLNFVFKNIELLKLLKKQNLFDFVLVKYNEYVNFYESNMTKYKNESSNIKHHNAITNTFKTGGFWNVISYWIDEYPMTPPDKLANILIDFIDHGLNKKIGL